MEIKGDKYRVHYDPQTSTIDFQGSLRRMGIADYAPIEKLLENVVEQNPPLITLNLYDLKLLNSAGIRMLSKFVIRIRNQKNIRMIINGTKDSTWQDSSLKNLQRLMPPSHLELRLH
ncbi:hypothetical protein IQ249_23525 [Lusitaniella coriacea LEGE 07157]|uniref:STAS domain-containing protein n=1 Tax=Lusitaniella coriacea LEGE 07157 TaxID=945747 RepID=A0A8J7J6Q9_9CYAN|nr:hypothetical protein [Lusitaniella coriacea]MBE9118864.1 hypothetical protein [Lusitaniella coriacea LEGE 07157]